MVTKCLMKLFSDVGRLVLDELVFVRNLVIKVLKRKGCGHAWEC